jgi:hypothetical protein
MSVIRLRAGQACPVCGGTTSLPHASMRDCQSASEREPREGPVRAHAPTPAAEPEAREQRRPEAGGEMP